ncbi:kinase-like domain-containing protein [Dactylonectria macrodidyma]|uniref:Kinase-like domain-containing protein n=1 Tax=Dactylonectria macrodidyma TaxID=307937 RepID=A0A9P9CZE4_9HYPO|nr:kinase-like domain-containing protein [Dactylonectria macrodidyma]
MASPSSLVSDQTSWDPLGPNSPAAEALIILRPDNPAAKLAFSAVVDFLREQHEGNDEDGFAKIQAHYSRFIWYSNDQVTDDAVTRLVQSASRHAGSSSPSSSSNSNLASPELIWTGFYFLDPSITPLIPSLGWSLGRMSSKNPTFGQPTVDFLLTVNKRSLIARRHARISFSNETRLARLTLDFGKSMAVNTHKLTGNGSSAACQLSENAIHIEDLQYVLEYAPQSYRTEGRDALNKYLKTIHGVDQPTPAALLATPTPTVHSQTLGKYTFTGAGLVGSGSLGRVRPATCPAEDRLVAIKTIEVQKGHTQLVRTKIDKIGSLSRLLVLEKQLNILRMIDSVYIQGTKVDEFHVVLEPYVETTLTNLPRNTHYTKYEVILRDCLRGLCFLHSENIVHTDIKPPNIGLMNLNLDQVQEEASHKHPLPVRPLRAIILDIDSMEEIPRGQNVIMAKPGTNGTLGFHSPEHEQTGYDGRTDVWSLGVSFFRVIFGRLPWSLGPQGNPWRYNVRNKEQLQALFHAKYKEVLDRIERSHSILGGSLPTFLLQSFRFRQSDIRSQREPRPSSVESLDLLMRSSDFLAISENDKQQRSTALTAGSAKRPAPDSSPVS